MNSLNQLFEVTIKDLYSSEEEFLRGMASLVNAAESPKLKATIEDHILQSEVQLQRLQEIGRTCEIQLSGGRFQVATALVIEADMLLETLDEGSARDAAIILCAQRIEYYEITTYGSLIAWANVLRLHEVHHLLMATFNEERTADYLLSDVGKLVNKNAHRKQGDLPMSSRPPFE